jgi:catechol 2,3-dioxygenase-like lactoylglutathione lyase family enzyme
MEFESVNHIALQVRDAQKSAVFYQRFCGMEVVHARKDGDINIRWVQIPGQKDGFMIVLLETLAQIPEESGGMDHIGIYVKSRGDVDHLAAMAKSEGLLIEEPRDGGPIIGYYCMIQDPDGNQVEFSADHARIDTPV